MTRAERRGLTRMQTLAEIHRPRYAEDRANVDAAVAWIERQIQLDGARARNRLTKQQLARMPKIRSRR